MNTTLNLYVVLLLPVTIVVIVALARWLRSRDSSVLGSRLRRWGFWAVAGTNVALLGVISLTMLAESEDYSLMAALGTVLITIAAPAVTWFWLRHGGHGVPIAMWALVGATLALAVAACVAPAYWTDVVNDVYPVGILSGAVGLALAVWGRTTPVQAGVALLVLGILPLSLAGAVAAASEILVMLFAALPIYAVLGVLFLVGHHLEAGPTVHREWRARSQRPSIAQ